MGKNKKFKSLSELGGMVYSTDPDYQPDLEQDEIETLPPAEQLLYVSYDKKHRKGKVVTLVEGFQGSDEALSTLGKYLKNKCGAGGTAKDGEILVQGNFVQKICELLEKDGYRVKKKGG